MAQKAITTLKMLIIGYVITIVMLFLLSFILYKFAVSETVVTVGITITYAVSCLVGGLFLAKKEMNRRVLWGIAYGVLYYVILFIISMCMNKGVDINVTSAVRALLVCVISGALGGFFSP